MTAVWVKSSLSFSNGNCVEVTELPGGSVGIRNSREPGGPVLRFTRSEWDAFLGARGAASSTGSAPRRLAGPRTDGAHDAGRYLPKRSNSPFLTPPINACHSSGVNTRTAPAESLLLRTPTSPPARPATSTQLPQP
jgi:hypothetical protein